MKNITIIVVSTIIIIVNKNYLHCNKHMDSNILKDLTTIINNYLGSMCNCSLCFKSYFFYNFFKSKFKNLIQKKYEIYTSNLNFFHILKNIIIIII